MFLKQLQTAHAYTHKLKCQQKKHTHTREKRRPCSLLDHATKSLHTHTHTHLIKLWFLLLSQGNTSPHKIACESFVFSFFCLLYWLASFEWVERIKMARLFTITLSVNKHFISLSCRRTPLTLIRMKSKKNPKEIKSEILNFINYFLFFFIPPLSKGLSFFNIGNKSGVLRSNVA